MDTGQAGSILTVTKLCYFRSNNNQRKKIRLLSYAFLYISQCDGSTAKKLYIQSTNTETKNQNTPFFSSRSIRIKTPIVICVHISHNLVVLHFGGRCYGFDHRSLHCQMVRRIQQEKQRTDLNKSTRNKPVAANRFFSLKSTRQTPVAPDLMNIAPTSPCARIFRGSALPGSPRGLVGAAADAACLLPFPNPLTVHPVSIPISMYSNLTQSLGAEWINS